MPPWPLWQVCDRTSCATRDRWPVSDGDRDKPERGASDSRRTRDHLANERTFMAWMRTGFAVMALGLALAQFGPVADPEGRSVPAGISLIVAGAVVMGYGLTRYRRINTQIDEDHHVTGQRGREVTAAALVIVVAVVAAVLLLLL